MQTQNENFQETIPANESTMTQQITELSIDMQPKEPTVPRNQHPKSHGCVRAEFIVEKDIPENMRFGVFKEPKLIRLGFASLMVKVMMTMAIRDLSLYLMHVVWQLSSWMWMVKSFCQVKNRRRRKILF